MSDADAGSIYKSPEAVTLDVAAEGAEGKEFFSVSLAKLKVMYILTLGMYSLVFFFQNWKIQKARHQLKVIPVLRAIFSIFFTHSLFARISDTAKQRGIEHGSSFKTQATIFVACMVISALLGRIEPKGADYMIVTLISIALTLIALVPLVTVQKTVLKINGEEDAPENSDFTVYNWIWIFLGVILWLLMFVGMFAMLAGVQ